MLCLRRRAGHEGGEPVIHYHGTPITPASAAAEVLAGRHAFVSFRDPRQLEIAQEVAQSFALDNGAFSAWQDGEPITDWSPFYAWVAEARSGALDFAIIPDVIDGTEAQNDALIDEWPWPDLGVPVWHLHESLERLERLCAFPRVALGSSGEYAQIGSVGWERRMAEAMAVLCEDDGRPRVRIHGLRMLSVDVFTRFPFASADSCNIGRNIGIDSAWTGRYSPPDKPWRARIMAARIEAFNAPRIWTRSPQLSLLERQTA
jgi:hypothetical protein